MKKTILLFAFLAIACNVFSQNINSNNKLYAFFQKNTDSAIFYTFDNYSSGAPNFLILSKKGDTVSAFTYKLQKNQDEDRSNLPFSIRYALFLRDRYDITKIPIDINQYFNQVKLQKDTLNYFWNLVAKLNPWKLDDDIQNGYGCPINKNGGNKEISDGGGISLDLITKNKIKHLHFYAPQYYEKQCPGRLDRQIAIKIELLFSKYFKE